MQLNLTLAAVDLEKTEKFYREVLMLSPKFVLNSHAEKSYLLLTFGNMKIIFQPLQDVEAQHPVLLQNLTRSPRGVGMQLEMECNNLEEIYHQVHLFHWPIAYELEDQQHQRRELWLHDPDGYLLVLNEEHDAKIPSSS